MNSFLDETTRDVRMLAEEVRPSLGPVGLDRLVLSGNGRAVVSNAGSEILGKYRGEDLGPGAAVVRDAALGHVKRWGAGCKALVVACAAALDVVAAASASGRGGAGRARRVGQALASVSRGRCSVLRHCLDEALAGVAVKAPSPASSDGGGVPLARVLERLVDTALWGALAPDARNAVRRVVVTLATLGGALADAEHVATHLRAVLARPPICVVEGAGLAQSTVLTGVMLDAGLARPSMRTHTPAGSSFAVLIGASLDPEVPDNGRAKVAVATPEAWAAQAAWRDARVAERVAALAARGVRLVLCAERVAEGSLRVCEEAGLCVVHGIDDEDLERVLEAMRAQVRHSARDVDSCGRSELRLLSHDLSLPVIVGECTLDRIQACPIGRVTCQHRQLAFAGGARTSHLTFASASPSPPARLAGPSPVAYTLLLRAPSGALALYYRGIVHRCLTMLLAWAGPEAGAGPDLGPDVAPCVACLGGCAAEAAIAEAFGPESVARALQLPQFAHELSGDADAIALAGASLAAAADAVTLALVRNASLGWAAERHARVTAASLRQDARQFRCGATRACAGGDGSVPPDRLILLVGEAQGGPSLVGIRRTGSVDFEHLPLEPLETKLALFLSVADLVHQLTRIEGVLRVRSLSPRETMASKDDEDDDSWSVRRT